MRTPPLPRRPFPATAGTRTRHPRCDFGSSRTGETTSRPPFDGIVRTEKVCALFAQSVFVRRATRPFETFCSTAVPHRSKAFGCASKTLRDDRRCVRERAPVFQNTLVLRAFVSMQRNRRVHAPGFRATAMHPRRCVRGRRRRMRCEEFVARGVDS